VEVLTAVDRERIRELRARDHFFWLDLLHTSHDDLEALADVLGIHPAAIEDSREWDQLPKLDEFDTHALLVFFTAEVTDERTTRPLEVHVYISGHWIVTVRRCATPLDRLRDRLASTHAGAEDQILYHVLDALADGWDPVLQSIDERVDVVEAAVLDRPQQEHLTVIYRLKQEVGELMRRAHPQRERFPAAIDVIHGLEGFDRGDREWLGDVDAHLDTIASDLRRLSNDLAALTDTFFNANANRLNRLATQVAIGSVFFLVWTLVTGFFGQNFKWLVDHVESEKDFLLFGLGGMLIPTAVLVAVLWLKRGDW
jgi:magnesium transporter